jgi:hypothetical protein
MLYKNAKNTDNWIRLYLKGLHPIGAFRRREEEIKKLVYVTKRPLTYILDEFRDAYMETDVHDIIVDVQDDYLLKTRMKMDFGYFPVTFIRHP